MSKVPDTAYQKVVRSWDIIQDRKEEVGLEFIGRIFKDRPDLRHLFPFAAAVLRPETANDPAVVAAFETALKAHARMVMNTVGQCVAGLRNIEDVVPILRSLGSTHQNKGIRPEYYDLFFIHLMGALSDKLGPEEWTDDTEEAWRLSAGVIKTFMTTTGVASQNDRVTGWVAVMAVVCLFEAIIEPLKLAGFIYSNFVLVMLGQICMICFAIDFYASIIAKRDGKEQPKLFKQLRMDQCVYWPRLDGAILASFPLQHIGMLLSYTIRKKCAAAGAMMVGVSWFHGFGVIRILSVARVIHAFRSIENSMLITFMVDSQTRLVMRITKILLTLGFVTHVCGCLWCTVARIQMNSNLEYLNNPTIPTGSSFFPAPKIFVGQTFSELCNGYAMAMHWAWVNLSGVGNSDSIPETTLEICFIILVHFIGATLYATITANVVSMMEEANHRENEALNDMAHLSDFMGDANIPHISRNRIMQGYVMRNMIANNTSKAKHEKDAAAFERKHDVDVSHFPDHLATRIPTHLRKELLLHARADSLQKRSLAFQSCSTPFRVMLVTSLNSTLTFLPGDYLFEQNQILPTQFFLVETGTFAVLKDGRFIKTLSRGDCIGKAWMLNAIGQGTTTSLISDSTHSTTIIDEEDLSGGMTSNSDDDDEDQTENSAGGLLVPIEEETTANAGADNYDESKMSYNGKYSEWKLMGGDISGASIRALEPCTVVTGLSSRSDIHYLHKRFPEDFDKLKDDRRRCMLVAAKALMSYRVQLTSGKFKMKVKDRTVSFSNPSA